MTDVIRLAHPVARKRYECNSCLFLRDVLNDRRSCPRFTYHELRTIVKAKRNGWCIVPGQKYIYQFARDSGETFVTRSIPEIHEICRKYDLYHEW